MGTSWKRSGVVSALVIAAVVLQAALADEHNHKYDDGEQVVLWMNTVGPYHNRQETYGFYTLPFCKGPEKVHHHHESLGESIQGVELKFSGLDIKFNTPVGVSTPMQFCEVQLTEDKYKAFVYAVKHHYWYQMYIDDMPMWALVGDFGEGHTDHEKEGSTPYIWTNKKLDIGVNNGQIVDVNLTTSKRVPLQKDTTLHFTYQVTWKKSDIPFSKRYEKYLDTKFFQHRIHWFAIFNSFMMVLFLVGLVTMILFRTLKKDFARYSREGNLDDMERDLGDEYGWKQIHGDVFRPPSHPILFTALIGTGCQLATVALLVILVSIAGDLYTARGSILTTAVFVYAAASIIAGFFGGGMYAKMGGKQWIKQTMTTALLMPAVVCTVVIPVNFIAMYYNATREIEFGTMVFFVCVMLFVVVPLTTVGAVLGRNLNGTPDSSVRVNVVPRPIPEKKWFMEPLVIILLGGILPFGSIFIEMYFIFTSFWAYKIYYVFGFMLLVFLILATVTVCVTIVCTYFLLNSEDYRWYWTSFLTSASTALYVYIYATYYFFFKTKMFGAFQTSFYFGYSALMAFGLAVLCGTFGHLGTSVFVKKIYDNIKID